MLAAGPVPCSVGITDPVPIDPADGPFGAAMSGMLPDRALSMAPVAPFPVPDAAPGASVFGTAPLISGIGRSAGVGVRAGGEVGCGVGPIGDCV